MNGTEAVVALAVNTIILTIGIPIGIWGIRTMKMLVIGVTKLNTALLGLEGEGGTLEEVQMLRRRMHRMESHVTALIVHTGLAIEKD